MVINVKLDKGALPSRKFQEGQRMMNALKLIESALNEWGFDTVINSDPSFP